VAGADGAERLSLGERRARLGVAVLSVVGVADSLYMLSHTSGLVESLFCPFFGKGCDIVGESEHAKHLGIPNSVVGAVGYAVMGSLALWAGDKPPERRPWQPLGLAAASTAAFAASAVLTWKQAALVKAWCFWCLSSAAINLAILPVALRDGRRALKGIRG
jgi:uncharacterized membrane protein